MKQHSLGFFLNSVSPTKTITTRWLLRFKLSTYDESVTPINVFDIWHLVIVPDSKQQQSQTNSKSQWKWTLSSTASSSSFSFCAAFSFSVRLAANAVADFFCSVISWQVNSSFLAILISCWFSSDILSWSLYTHHQINRKFHIDLGPLWGSSSITDALSQRGANTVKPAYITSWPVSELVVS